MIFRLPKYAAFFLLLCLSIPVSAQVLDPISWSFSQEKTGNREYELIFTAEIENKWHLYSQKLPEGGPIPTFFRFDASGDFRQMASISRIFEEVKALCLLASA